MFVAFLLGGIDVGFLPSITPGFVQIRAVKTLSFVHICMLWI